MVDTPSMSGDLNVEAVKSIYEALRAKEAIDKGDESRIAEAYYRPVATSSEETQLKERRLLSQSHEGGLGSSGIGLL